MGVNPTPSNFKTFTFDNTNSAQYGVYITGQGVFNAPERNVEMVEIPGRNGAYALDKGNFNNIEVTYPAGIVADTEADFAQAMSDFRNFLCSKSGYCRLTDDYNSGEYRMAIYKSGLEVEHEGLLTGEFNITFECKPQRWLTSGETKTTLTSGDTVTNPTLFQSSPLLETYGYGDIDIGGQIIKVKNKLVGDVIVANNQSSDNEGVILPITFDGSVGNTGDDLKVTGISLYLLFSYGSLKTITGTPTSTAGTGATSSVKIINSSSVEFTLNINDLNLAYKTSYTNDYAFTCRIPTSDGPDNNIGNIHVNYSGGDYISFMRSGTYYSTASAKISVNSVIINSTKSALGNPMYIDLDIGECWNADNGTPVSVNNSVYLPAELPTLPSGATTITFDNTFTKVDIVPRWWKV